MDYDFPETVGNEKSSQLTPSFFRRLGLNHQPDTNSSGFKGSQDLDHPFVHKLPPSDIFSSQSLANTQSTQGLALEALETLETEQHEMGTLETDVGNDGMCIWVSRATPKKDRTD